MLIRKEKEKTNMKKITVYEKNDIKILESHLTDGHSPCCECDSITRMACCGCPEARSYNEKHKEVKEAGLEDTFIAILEYKDTQKAIKALEHQLTEKKKDLEKQKKRFEEDGLNEILDLLK